MLAATSLQTQTCHEMSPSVISTALDSQLKEKWNYEWLESSEGKVTKENEIQRFVIVGAILITTQHFLFTAHDPK